MLVVIWDGNQLASTYPKATREKADPVIDMRQLLRSLCGGGSRQKENLLGRECWHFSQRDGANMNNVWLDAQSHFPVRLLREESSGERMDISYNQLPFSRGDANHNELFNIANLAPTERAQKYVGSR